MAGSLKKRSSYAQQKATQVLAKDAFSAINEQTAASPS